MATAAAEEACVGRAAAVQGIGDGGGVGDSSGVGKGKGRGNMAVMLAAAMTSIVVAVATATMTVMVAIATAMSSAPSLAAGAVVVPSRAPGSDNNGNYLSPSPKPPLHCGHHWQGMQWQGCCCHCWHNHW